MPTARECQSMLFQIGVKLGVSPKLISERLLSIDDKKALLEGCLSITDVELHTVTWVASGMPDYAHGKTEALQNAKNPLKSEKPFKDLEKGGYRAPFVDYRITD